MTGAAVLDLSGFSDREGWALLIEALDPEGDSTRLVGGVVRDTLLGLPVNDVDLATRHEPQIVMHRLEAAGIKAVPTGIAHGTVTAVLPSGVVEITTLRRDVETDGRHAVIAYAQDWHEDAARRDFTINALYADPRTGTVFDYHDGLGDLKRRIVRFIGDAEQRIREDYLRILRFFRFAARFGGGHWDRDALAACARLADGMKGLSRERISGELLRLLALPDPVPALREMEQAQIWRAILPEIAAKGIDALAQLIQREQRSGLAQDLSARLLALLGGQEPSPALLVRLRLSNRQQQRIIAMSRAADVSQANVRELVWRTDMGIAQGAILIHGKDDWQAMLALIDRWQVPHFALKGRDVLAAGQVAGPDVARLLKQCERAWIDEGFPDEPRQRAILAELMRG